MSEKVFSAEIVRVADLFQHRNIFFEVPQFQRPYRWGEEQIEQFWDDIYSAWKEGRKSYFLGPMIFAKKEESYGYKYIVIDGQQRLTTLQIFFCTIRDLFLKNNKIYDSMFKERIQACISSFNRFKLKLQPEHHSKFENTILKGIEFPDIKSKSELLKLRQKNRYLYVAYLFKKKLQDNFKNQENIKNFVEFILENVEMVEIKTKEIAEAIRIFQVVNTRGLDLTPADVIKASLYIQTPEDRLREFKSLWQKIEEIANEQERDLTQLLTYYVYYCLAPNRPRKAIQDEIDEIFENRKKEDTTYTTTNLLYDVREFVDAISYIENMQNNTAIITMRYLPNETYWLTILASAVKENYKDLDELIVEIRRLFYLYWLAGYTSQKLRQPSLRIIDDIKSGLNIDYIKNFIERKLNDDDVYRLVLENLYNDVYGQRWLKPLLLLLEYEYSEPVKTIYVDLKKVHVEHILPERWKKNSYWRELWTDNEAKKWLNKLGNLTLLYSKINESIQNSEFPKKLDTYKGQEGKAPTSFILTRKLFQIKHWTPKEAEKRHKWMIKEISKILCIPLNKEEN